MEIFTQGLAICGCVLAFTGAGYSLWSSISSFRMKRENQKLGAYVKNKSFLRMKNAGEDPCDTNSMFKIPEFSQDCDYLLRRNSK